MSAFLCNPRHIGVLSMYVSDDPVQFQLNAKILGEENLASLRARYPDTKEKGPTATFLPSLQTDEAYIHACMEVPEGFAEATENPVHVISLLRCWDYQACEHPEHQDPDNTSMALYRRILELAIVQLPPQQQAIARDRPSNLPGFDEAPWELPWITSEDKDEDASQAPSDDAYRAAASWLHSGVEVDGDAKVSRGDDDGAYVQAWVWVPESNAQEEGKS